MPSLAGRVLPVLTVRDLARSTAWYADVLRMEVRRQYADRSGGGDACLVEPTSGVEICLVAHDASQGDAFSELRTGLDHLEILVTDRSDLDEWATRLDSLGVAHSGVKQPTYSRNAMLTFRDPDNIQLELFWQAP